jgi:lysophospholipase L1-like esterase
VRGAHESVKGLLAKLLLAVVSTALMLGALEAVARWAHYKRGGGKEMNEQVRYVESDPRLGWRKRPGARVTYVRREYTVEVAINSQGLRDPERSYAKPVGAFRVLALGDSFVEAYSVPLEETFTQRLEKSLGDGCPVEVINGGTAAYSADQEYLFYLDQGARYDPDVVLLFFYYNDVLASTWERYFGGPKPLLAWEAEQLIIKNEPVPRLPKPPPPGPAPSPEPIEGSAALAWARERLMRGAPRVFSALSVLGLWGTLGGDEPDEQLRVYKRRRQPTIEAAWSLVDKILKRLAREAEQRDARFAVAYVPSRMEVSDRDWELTRLVYSLNEAWDRGLVIERVREIGVSGGFPVLDLTPALREASGGLRGEPYYLFDGHWNALGHATVARAVEDFLKERGWLSACLRVAASKPGS